MATKKEITPAAANVGFMSVLADLGIDVTDRELVDANDVIDGMGFAQMEKDSLLGRPFVIVGYNFAISEDYTDKETGEPLMFVVVRLVTADGDKGFFTDGSTGIMQQVKSAAAQYSWAETNQEFAETDYSKAAVIVCKQGLRKSEYNKAGVGKATTYYIA